MKGLDDVNWDELLEKADKIGDRGLWYLERFYALRFEHSDDLLETDVRDLPRTDPRYDKFKCQGNYIAGLGFDLQGAIWDKVITERTLIEDIKKFVAHKFNYQKGLFTSKDEINMMNSLLDDSIGYLQSGNR